MKKFKQVVKYAGGAVLTAGAFIGSQAQAAVPSSLPADIGLSQTQMESDVTGIGAIVVSLALLVMGIMAVRRTAR